MHSHVLLEVILPYATMRSGTSLQICCLKCMCHNVTIEPTLQPVTRETFKLASTITDIRHCSWWFLGWPFWKKRFSISEFSTHLLHLTPHPHPVPLATADMKKKNKEHIEQRIREIEHASFTPIVLSTTGGMGPIATTFYKRLADRLASKWNSSYSQTIGWLRCRLTFFSPPLIHLMHQRSSFIKGTCTLQCSSPSRASA